jgi:hemolysin III
MSDALRAGRDSFAETVAEVKPRLRGWLHLGSVPLTLAAGIVLVALSPTAATRTGSAVYAVSALMLFTVSAVYHRGNWSDGTARVLRRFDHANIFLLIAGSYTPFTLLLLHGTERVVLLVTVWTAALLGVVFRVLWISAPRWLHTPIYIAMGWVVVFFLGDFAHGAEDRFGVGLGLTVVILIAVGGALYTLGAVVYGFKRPNPWPQWFGFHEIFHSFTIAAFVCHYAAASIATYRLR